MSIEKSLIIFKPDAVQRGLVGEITTRFERAGLKIIGMKMMHPGYEHYFKHYEEIGQMVTRRGQKPFDMTLAMMQKGPVIAMVLEGVGAVALIRKMVGTTEPASAAPGTIRGDYSHISFEYADKANVGVPNLLHASGSPEEAKKEIAHWFSDNELFGYSVSHESYTQGK